MRADWTIRGARALLGDRLETAEIRVTEGRIGGAGGTVIDGGGLWLLPAMVDVHGDAFERQVMPRPGVAFPIEAACLETDRQLAGNGIATAYHALSLSWEPGLRSLGQAEVLLDALAMLGPRLAVENRVQLRWETFAFEARPLIDRALAGPLTPAIAFNDHTSMALRSFDVPLQERAFEHSPAFVAADPDDPRLGSRLASNARRAGLAPEAYVERLTAVWERRRDVPGAIAEVAAAGRAAAAPMLSHDDSQAETRAFYRSHGARLAEFPMREPVARSAREAGDVIVFGAPNVVRGGSHLGASPSAADMVEAGLCDILASDYFYPAMLAAIARLHAERRAPLARLWALVSANPARASGLTNRGRIADGARADLILVDWPETGEPAAMMTMSAGRIAHLSRGIVG